MDSENVTHTPCGTLSCCKEKLSHETWKKWTERETIILNEVTERERHISVFSYRRLLAPDIQA